MLFRAEHGLLPPAERSAAESDVAGLPSEATATFGVGWLTPPLQHSDTNESGPAQISHFVRRPARPTMKALRGFCRVPAWPTMYWAAAELQLARHDTLASSPQLLIKKLLSA